MVPQWVKKSWIYPSLRRTASALEKGLLQMEYALLSRPKRQKELWEQIRVFPHSNGSRFYTQMRYRVGIVADQFLFDNYFCTCNLVYLTPENWLDQLPTLDCVIVTSVWHGLGGEWTGASSPGSACSTQLYELMKETRRRGCPIIFYSKEDPPNFDCFQMYAGLADQIYTSARECIDHYLALYPSIPVDTMPFAISPLLHNPIGMKPLDRNMSTAFFAGSWMKKYPERVAQQKQFFDWTQKSGLLLEIADRNYSRYSLRYRYPLRYLRSVFPDLPYSKISILYKLHSWILNFNSVIDSLDMFSLRVYDALACGSLVLSNNSIGMQTKFPQVYVINSYEQMLQVINTPIPLLEQRRLDGVRQVFRAGTAYERMQQMLSSVGLVSSCVSNNLIGVILSKNISDKTHLKAMFESQTYNNKLLIESHEDTAQINRCGILTLWDNGHEYSPTYLEDMINCFKYTSCDYITKHSTPSGEAIPGNVRHGYTQWIANPYATIFGAEVYARLGGQIPSKGFLLPNGYATDGSGYGFDSQQNAEWS